MQEILSHLQASLLTINRIILSSPKKKDPDEPDKITLLRHRNGTGKDAFFAEFILRNQAHQKRIEPEELADFVMKELQNRQFRQVNLFDEKGEIAFRISKKGKISQTVNRKSPAVSPKEEHNREKNYLIREGDAVPFLVDLGVFTADHRIVKSKYDKFRQINRFIELLDHAFCENDQEEISVLDFGCGKSYLTFFVYYYFAVLRKKRVHITGYDLKKDVVEHCNALAKSYGYHGLQFIVADVTKDALKEEKIDFVISLHACDIATDYALNFALEHQVPYIFSVPCCQHEINASIGKGNGDLDLFLGHGLFRERMSALLTDAFRVRILEAEGYRTDVLEFVDFAHSPKNLMIRAKRKSGAKRYLPAELQELEEKYGFQQTLYHLRKESLL